MGLTRALFFVVFTGQSYLREAGLHNKNAYNMLLSI